MTQHSKKYTDFFYEIIEVQICAAGIAKSH